MRKWFSKILLIEVMFFLFVIFLFSENSMYRTLKENIIGTVKNEESNIYNMDKTKLYLEIEKALLNGDEQITIRDLNIFKEPKEIFNILERISNQNPEVMYYKGAEYKFGQLQLFYSKSKDDIKRHKDEIRAKREEFISKYIGPNMSDYEKTLIIHDYIINNARYDERLIQDNVVPPESYSTYGTFVLGVGVCEGYAKTMKYLLDAAEVESLIVIGQSRNENHAWNLVKLGNEFYHIDPTWNDPITNDGTHILRYNFFNLRDEEITKTHKWIRENYPNALGEKYNYYGYNDLIVRNKNELEEKLKNTLSKKKSNLGIKIENLDEEKIDINGIIEDYVYENYYAIGLKSYSYSIDEDYNIINFSFLYY